METVRWCGRWWHRNEAAWTAVVPHLDHYYSDGIKPTVSIVRSAPQLLYGLDYTFSGLRLFAMLANLYGATIEVLTVNDWADELRRYVHHHKRGCDSVLGMPVDYRNA